MKILCKLLGHQYDISKTTSSLGWARDMRGNEIIRDWYKVIRCYVPCRRCEWISTVSGPLDTEWPEKPKE